LPDKLSEHLIFTEGIYSPRGVASLLSNVFGARDGKK